MTVTKQDIEFVKAWIRKNNISLTDIKDIWQAFDKFTKEFRWETMRANFTFGCVVDQYQRGEL